MPSFVSQMILFVVCLTCGQMAATQHRSVESDIMHLFDNPRKAIHIDRYEGLLNDAVIVQLAIGTLEGDIRGVCSFPEGGLRFEIEGEYRASDTLVLYEFVDDDVSAVMKLAFSDGSLKGHWINRTARLSLPMQMESVSAFTAMSEKTAVDSLSRFVSQGSDWQIDVYHRKGQLGVRWTDDTVTHQTKMSFETVDRTLKAKSGMTSTGLSSVHLTFQNDGSIQTFVHMPDQRPLFMKLFPEMVLRTYRRNHVDFDRITTIEYGATGFDHFDLWIEKRIDAIFEAPSFDQTNAHRDSARHVASRFQRLASVSVTYDHLSRDFISGWIDVIDNTQHTVETVAFIYDLKAKKALSLNDVFKSDFNYSFFLKQYIKRAKRSMAANRSLSERRWIDQCPFDIYTMDATGLTCSTPFSTIFGRESIVVPFEEFARYVKNDRIQRAITNR